MKVEPGGYWPWRPLSNKGLPIESLFNNLYWDDLSLPTNRLGSYPGELTSANISPYFGSMAIILPYLFFISESP